MGRTCVRRRPTRWTELELDCPLFGEVVIQFGCICWYQSDDSEDKNEKMREISNDGMISNLACDLGLRAISSSALKLSPTAWRADILHSSSRPFIIWGHNSKPSIGPLSKQRVFFVTLPVQVRTLNSASADSHGSTFWTPMLSSVRDCNFASSSRTRIFEEEKVPSQPSLSS